MADQLLLGVAESASYNILLQIVFRIQTFVLNAFILRYISRDVLGIINVRLMLLYSTITFLSTEPFKNACLSKQETRNWRQIINLLWITVPVAVVCSLIFCWLWLNALEQPNASLAFQYACSVFTIGVCCTLERFAEPLHVVAQILLLNKLKVLLQCITITLQCGIFATCVYLNPDNAIVGFCLGQAGRSIAWVLILYCYFGFNVRDKKLEDFDSVAEFFPSASVKNENFLNPEHVALSISFFKQGILKQMLTEGERYFMTILNVVDFANQGVYDVVSNLVAIAARFVFRPIEESGYHYFAQRIHRDKPLQQQDEDSVTNAANVLYNLMKLMIIIGLVIVTFGYSFSYLLLDVYGGKILSSGDGPSLMRWQCAYTLLIAVNGISEGFAFATMNKADIDKFNFLMVYISLVFLAVAWFLTPIFGTVGLILANCSNMVLRIIHSLYFIRKLFLPTKHSLKSILIHPAIVVALILAGVVTLYSEVLFCCDNLRGIFTHVVVGVVCLTVVGITVFLCERQLVTFMTDLSKLRTHSKRD